MAGGDRRVDDGIKPPPWYKTTSGRLTFILMILWLSVVLNVVTTVKTADGIDRERKRSCLIIAHLSVPDQKGLCR